MSSSSLTQSDPEPANNSPRSASPTPTSADVCRPLVRCAWKASLATLDRDSGHPYASLVAVATDPGGTPLLLLSDLAEHRRNFASDDRASLLFDGTGAGRDALTGPRVTLIGRIEMIDCELARRRYLARHPGAEGYIGFADFNLYRLVPERGHLVAGFGRISRLALSDIETPVDDAQALIEAEGEIVAHMNADHADANELLAKTLAGADPGPWTMTGCDPAGVDLVCGERAVRVDFVQRVTTPAAVRKALIDMVWQARGGGAGRP